MLYFCLTWLGNCWWTRQQWRVRTSGRSGLYYIKYCTFFSFFISTRLDFGSKTSQEVWKTDRKMSKSWTCLIGWEVWKTNRKMSKSWTCLIGWQVWKTSRKMLKSYTYTCLIGWEVWKNQQKDVKRLHVFDWLTSLENQQKDIKKLHVHRFDWLRSLEKPTERCQKVARV